MTLGLIVVGPSDKRSIPILARKVFEARRVRVGIVTRILPQGDMFNGRKVAALVNFMVKEDPEIGKVVLCVDSECTDPSLIQQKTNESVREAKRSGLHTPVQFVVVVHALEGWLMSDPEAVGRVLGTSMIKPIRSEPESECKPADVLADLFYSHDKDFNKTIHDPKIAERADPKRIEKYSGSFGRFVRAIILPVSGSTQETLR